MTAPAALAGLIAERAPRVLVLGDALLDCWLTGRSAPGGAANVAANLAALGATVELLSVVGADEGGATLLDVVRAHGVEVGRVVQDPTRPTPVKHLAIA